MPTFLDLAENACPKQTSLNPFHYIQYSLLNSATLYELIDARESACDTNTFILHLRVPQTVICHLQHMSPHHTSEPNHRGRNQSAHPRVPIHKSLYLGGCHDSHDGQSTWSTFPAQPLKVLPENGHDDVSLYSHGKGWKVSQEWGGRCGEGSDKMQQWRKWVRW